ncbi:MAG: 5'-methylthioadenosine/adenosylhomocysteine nucleosidase [Ruminococcaceae bacterium]|nr:5'-methylthioadenosine/adenosylhomocysteine nucleosidase [Oscillospiraceae bacterium]
MKIGIIGAMSVETDALKEQVKDAVSETVSGIEFVSGKLYGKDVVVAQCGIGKVFAAICAQTMIIRFGVDKIINTGVAGTLSDKLGILDIAVATEVVQHDMDTSPLGDPVGLISGINIVKIPASPSLSDEIAAAAESIGAKCVKGVIASGDQFINNKKRKNFIKSSFDAIACEMEGAAIGHVCYVNGVDFAIIRAISDNASGEADIEYPEMVRKAAAQSTAIIKKLLEGKS